MRTTPDGSLLIPCRGVLFDCDGVLVDSEDSVVHAWSRWAQVHALLPESVLPMVHGRRTEDTVRQLIDPQDQSAALEYINRLELEDAVSVLPVAGAVRFVGGIPHGRWAVVTSGTTALARARLAAAGLPQPAVLVTADDVRAGKPDPEGYASASARLGLAPPTVVVVEDSGNGVEAARRAGVSTVIGVSVRALDTDADVVVRDLTCLRWEDGVGVRREGVLREWSALGRPGREHDGTYEEVADARRDDRRGEPA